MRFVGLKENKPKKSAAGKSKKNGRAASRTEGGEAENGGKD